MINPLKSSTWSPYWVGGLIGILSWFTFITAGHALGVSTAFETTAGLIEKGVVPGIAEGNDLFKKGLHIDWGWMLVAGIALGAFLSSRLSTATKEHTKESYWQDRFGMSLALRYVLSFVGGAVMIIGARLAGGCTSGHGISGGLQLAASGWLFVFVAFSSGILISRILFTTRKGSSCSTQSGN